MFSKSLLVDFQAQKLHDTKQPTKNIALRRLGHYGYNKESFRSAGSVRFALSAIDSQLAAWLQDPSE